MDKTRFAGLTRLDPGDPFSIDGASFQSLNPTIIDRFLEIGARTHRHDGHAPLANPDLAPDVATATSGGLIPAATTIGMTYTLLDADGGESLPAPATTVTTDLPLDPPYEEPLWTIDPAGGTLTASTYYYALSLTDGAGGETQAGPPIAVDIAPGSDFNRVVFSGLGAIVSDTIGAAGWRLYKAKGTGNYHFLAAGDALTDTLTDDGQVCVDCSEAPPLENQTSRTNAITFTPPDVPINRQSGQVVAFRIYMGVDGDFRGSSLVEELPVAELGVARIYDTLATERGAPPDVSTSKAGANKLNPDTDLLDWHWKRPVQAYADLPDGDQGDVRVTLADGKLWVVLDVDGALGPGDWTLAGGGAQATNDVQRVAHDGTGGTFRLGWGDTLTAPLPFDATANQLRVELAALVGGLDNVGVVKDAEGWIVEATGARAGLPVALMTGDAGALTPAASTVTVTRLMQGGQLPTGVSLSDEGVPVAARPELDFRGDAVTVTDDPANDRTVITVTGSGGAGGGGGGGGAFTGDFADEIGGSIPDDGGEPSYAQAGLERTVTVPAPEDTRIGRDSSWPEVFVYLRHPAVEQLAVELTPPGGGPFDTIALVNGAPVGENIGASFTEAGRVTFVTEWLATEGENPTTGEPLPLPYFSPDEPRAVAGAAGRFRAAGDFRRLSGRQVGGDWKLKIIDYTLGNGPGELVGWGLRFRKPEPPPLDLTVVGPAYFGAPRELDFRGAGVTVEDSGVGSAIITVGSSDAMPAWQPLDHLLVNGWRRHYFSPGQPGADGQTELDFPLPRFYLRDGVAHFGGWVMAPLSGLVQPVFLSPVPAEITPNGQRHGFMHGDYATTPLVGRVRHTGALGLADGHPLPAASSAAQAQAICLDGFSYRVDYAGAGGGGGAIG